MCRPKADDGQDLSSTERQAGQKSRPLYDVPYMFEAREFLRKKLIGKKVSYYYYYYLYAWYIAYVVLHSKYLHFNTSFLYSNMI